MQLKIEIPRDLISKWVYLIRRTTTFPIQKQLMDLERKMQKGRGFFLVESKALKILHKDVGCRPF